MGLVCTVVFVTHMGRFIWKQEVSALLAALGRQCRRIEPAAEMSAGCLKRAAIQSRPIGEAMGFPAPQGGILLAVVCVQDGWLQKQAMTAPFLRTDRSQRMGEEWGCAWPCKLLVQAGTWSRARGVSFGCSSIGRHSQRERVSCSILLLQVIRMERGALPEEGSEPGLEG